MPRGNRWRLADHLWHLTERCHRRQFLLKFARDRRTWMKWLYAARQRFSLCVLNYQVTSNHVHRYRRAPGALRHACCRRYDRLLCPHEDDPPDAGDCGIGA